MLTGHRSWVTSVAFSPNGEGLASGGKDAAVKIWSLKTRKAEQSFSTVHEDIIWGIGFTPDGKRVVAGSEDGVLSVHSA